MSMQTFIFVWRISHEKWVHLILQAAEQLVVAWYTDFHIDFVWSGDLVSNLTSHALYSKHLFYHGRLPKEETMQWMSKATYALMPSLFLETFGLVALDSLAFGIPVIGERKGGLIPFIVDESLVLTQTHTLFVCMKNILAASSMTQYESLQKRSLLVASAYTSQQWIDRFWQLSKKCKKLLLVSDYAVDIGGIENYLFQIQKLLVGEWIGAELFWKKVRVTWWWRKLDLLIAGFNLSWVIRLRHKVRHQNYDLVWLHSVQRWWGWWALALLSIVKRQPVWCMYHDFWLVHPFPSAVYSIDQLQTAETFWWYLREGKKALSATNRYLWWWFLVSAKYIYVTWMFYRLDKVVDLHLVPSAFLLPYFQKKLSPQARIEVFQHFVSHAHDV